jgi:hypothetical protein
MSNSLIPADCLYSMWQPLGALCWRRAWQMISRALRKKLGTSFTQAGN